MSENGCLIDFGLIRIFTGYMKRTFTTLIAVFLIGSFSAFGQPTITSFSPASGQIGQTITINGSGFSATGNRVFFGNIEGSVGEESTTQIKVEVPAGYHHDNIMVQRAEDSLYAISAVPFIQTHCSNNIINYANTGFDFTTGTGGERSVAVGDFNSDGKLDIALAARFSDAIYVFENTSTNNIITFAAPITMMADNPQDIVVGDFNGDGHLDLATASFNDSHVGVFINAGLGITAFYSELEFPCGANPHSVWADDIDGDGRIDLMTGNFFDNSISILRNQGYFPGTASFVETTFSTGLCCEMHGIRTGDFDQDGDPDIAVAKRVGGIDIIINNSTPGNISMSSFGNVCSIGMDNIVIEDLDGDGLLDIAAVGQDTADLAIIRNTFDGVTLSFAPVVMIDGANTAYSVEAADLTGDDKIDLLIGNNNGNTIKILQNTSTIGNYSFDIGQYSGGANLQQGYDVGVGDFGGDGGCDAVNAPLGGTSMNVFEKKGVFPSFYITDTVALCKGDNYTFPDGFSVTNIQSPMTHESVFTTSSPVCDSIIETTVTLDQGNFGVSQIGDTLIADATGASYQWVDCSNNFAVLPSETNQLFAPSYESDFAAIITDNGCTDTSDCFTIQLTGTEGYSFQDQVSLYPNPTSDEVNINFGGLHQMVRIEIRDISGKLIRTETVYNTNFYTTILPAENGVYYIILDTEFDKAYLKVIRQ